MAQVQKSVDIIFNGVDKVSKVTSGVAKGLDSMFGRVSSLTGPLNDVTNSILAVEAAMVALSAYMLNEGYQAAVNYENSLLDLKKVLGDGEDGDANVAAYEAKLRKVSEIYGVLATDVIDSAASFKQAGYTISEAMELTQTSIRTSLISELDSDQASEAMISILKGFRLEATEAERVLNTLNYTSNNYATSAGKLGEALATIAPIASTAGFSLEEMTGAVTPIIEIFRSGTEAGIAYKTFLLQLSSDSSKVKGALGSLGISQTDEQTGELKSIKEIYDELAIALENVSEKQGIKIIKDLAGIDQAGRVLAAMKDYQKQLKINDGILKDHAKTQTSAQKEIEIALKSMQIQNDRFKNSLQLLAKTLGDEYAKGTADALKSLTTFNGALEKVIQSENAQVLFDQLNGALNGFSENLKQLAVNLPKAFDNVDLSELERAFGDVGKSLSDIFSIDTNDPKAIQDAIQFIVDTIVSLVDVTDGVITQLGDFFELVKAGAEDFNGLEAGTKKTTGEMLGLAKIFENMVPFMDGVTSGLEGIGDGLKLIAGAQAAKALTGFNVAMAATRFIPWIAAISAGVYALKSFIDHSDRARLGYLRFFGDEDDAAVQKEISQLKYKIGLEGELNKSQEQRMLLIKKARELTGDETINSENYLEKIKEIKQAFDKEQSLIKGTAQYKERILKEIAETEKKLADVRAKNSKADLENQEKANKAKAENLKLTKEQAEQEKEIKAQKSESFIDQFKAEKEQKPTKIDIDDKVAYEKLFNLRKALEDVSEETYVAELDFETKRAERALDLIQSQFNSIDSSINSTENLLSNAIDKLADENTGFFDRSMLNKLAQTEMDNRAEAIEMQRELHRLSKEQIESEIYYSNVKARSLLSSGDAQAERALVSFKAQMDSINDGVRSTERTWTSAIENLYNGMASGLSMFDKSELRDIAEQEMESKRKALKMQHEMNALAKEKVVAETNLIMAKTTAIKNGDSKITVKVDGMEPELQAMARKFFELAQIEAAGGSLLVTE